MSSEQISEKLLGAGLITRAQLDEALKVQAEKGDGDLLDILVSLRSQTKQAHLKCLATQSSPPAADLSKHEISPDLLALVPRQLVLQHEAIPIGKSGAVLTLGTVRPLSPAVLEKLETVTGLSVQALMCAPDDVRNCIERYYAETEQTPESVVANLASPKRLQDIAALIRRIDRLPALPETVARVRKTMDDPDSMITDMANIILRDPPIAARMLSVANSAAYGFPQRVNDVNFGVTLLGMRETYNLVLSCSVLNYAEQLSDFDYRAFWRRSQSCAAASRVIAKRCGRENAFGLYSAALLHDLGRMALSEVAPELHTQIDQSLPGDERIAQEVEVLGITHAEAGYMLATQWRLPLEIAEPIRLHHRPELALEVPDSVMVVALAVVLSRATGAEGEADELFVGCDGPLEHLGIEQNTLADLVTEFLVERENTHAGGT